MNDTPIETSTRHVTRIVLVPLRKGSNVFLTAREAMCFLDSGTPLVESDDFGQYEIRIEFSNGDMIEAMYNSKERVKGFIEFFAS